MTPGSTNTTRKLAAILFADIEGYTAIMQKDETRATLMLRRFQDQLKSIVERNNGEVVNFYGDGALCTFHTPSEAVKCGKDLQESFLTEPVVPVRIGIHSGTVIFENEKVFGDSVNIASRIESLGSTGSVLLSKTVRDQVKNKPEFELVPVGKYRFKHIDEPMMVYALGGNGLNVPGRLHIAKSKPQYLKVLQWTVPILLIFIFGLLYSKYISPENENSIGFSTDFIEDSQIAIGVFDNNSTFKEYDIVGKMAADWITHGIIENQIAPVISYEAMDQYNQVAKAGIGIDQLLDAFKGDIKVIKGVYYVADTNLIFQCSVFDQKTKSVIYAFKNVPCSADEPLVGIEKMTDQILGYWVSQRSESIISKPPTYTAYQYYLKAKEYWSDDYDIADSLLRISLQADPDFLNAKVLLAALNYNTQQYDVVDSVITSMDQETMVNKPFQANTIAHYRALLDGNSKRVFETYRKEYLTAPKDLFTNTAMMVIALTFVNRPEMLQEIYSELNNEILEYANCNYCMVRKETLAESMIAMGKYQKAIDVLESLQFVSKRRQPLEYLVKAYVRTHNFGQLDKMLKEAPNKLQDINIHYLYFLSAHEAQLSSNKEMTTKYGQLAIDGYLFQDPLNHKMLGRTYFVMEEYDSAKIHLEKYLSKYPSDIFSMGKLASIAHIHQEPDTALMYINKMIARDRPYDYGYTAYMIAQAYASDGQYGEAFRYLKQSVKEGHRFAFINYENDPVFKPMHKMQEWDEVMKFWW